MIKHNDHQETSKQKRKHKRSMNLYAKVICCAILFGAISGGMVLGSFMIGKNAVKTTASSTTLETNAAKLSTSSGSKNGSSSSSGDTYTVAQIAEQCKSSVVAITNQSVQEVQTMFGTMQQQSTGSGSGVIIGKNDTELLVATNNHVVSGANRYEGYIYRQHTGSCSSKRYRFCNRSGDHAVSFLISHLIP